MKRVKAISVTVPYELAEAMEKIGKKEMKSVSSIVSEAVQTYCLKKDFTVVREDFSERARKLGIITEDDIDRVVHEYRQERKKTKNNG
jgi:metal-responsive CopG/Arc/MetJ family transcriptional regulator